eukprot:TRINITY_DN39012_c0_g1_i1.p1 TRINITY_DN39012_c0_g1~~TRINITY_DN39012_c0_g1_i1.p1  ORF type:complete len:376 (+),score=59.56 TRINITY_DN39012_c0_g1_i1:269-1396(+)
MNGRGRLLLTVAGVTVAVGVVVLIPWWGRRSSKRRFRIAKTVIREDTFYDDKGVKFEEKYFINDREMRLYAPRWGPKIHRPRALILLLHGYAVECSIFWKATATRLAQDGYLVCGLDYEGHGLSEGLHGYLPSMDSVVGDCIAYSESIRGEEENRGLSCFMYAASMGGAVALLIHRQQPDAWAGAVLLAPMCKIADDLKPPPLLIAALVPLARMFPRLPLVPIKDFLEMCSRDAEYKREVRANPLIYFGWPRLGTALTLLRTSQDLESRLHEVRLPFLLLHGKDDKVTDPGVSRLLHDEAQSEDKRLILYPGMWHCLTDGDTEDACDRVWKDILAWLHNRSIPDTSSPSPPEAACPPESPPKFEFEPASPLGNSP